MSVKQKVKVPELPDDKGHFGPYGGIFVAETLIPALTPQPLIVGASLVATGLMSMIWNVITVSLRQRIAPDELLGRVNAGYRLFASGTMPVGALLGGPGMRTVNCRQAKGAVSEMLSLPNSARVSSVAAP